MMLEDAIKHAEEVAEQNEEDAVIYLNCKKYKKNLYEIGLAENAEKKCRKCAEEHRQLAEWLKELKRYKEQGPCAFCKHHSFEESAPCFRCPAGMSFAENVIVKVVKVE